jgi:hypothetical protein
MEVVEHFGIDWPPVNGMDVLTAQTVLTSGRHVPDAFFTEKQFH